MITNTPETLAWLMDEQYGSLGFTEQELQQSATNESNPKVSAWQSPKYPDHEVSIAIDVARKEVVGQASLEMDIFKAKLVELKVAYPPTTPVQQSNHCLTDNLMDYLFGPDSEIYWVFKSEIPIVKQHRHTLFTGCLSIFFQTSRFNISYSEVKASQVADETVGLPFTFHSAPGFPTLDQYNAFWKQVAYSGLPLNTKKMTLRVNTKKMTLRMNTMTMKKLIPRERDRSMFKMAWMTKKYSSWKIMMDGDIDPDTRGARLSVPHSPLLINAVRNGNLYLTKFLVGLGANVNDDDGDRYYSVIYHAILAGNLATIKFLIEKGANTFIGTPLHVACEQGKLPICKLLHSLSADVNATCKDYHDTPMHCAVKSNCFEVVKWMVNHGARLDIRRLNNLYGNAVLTPLEEAHHERNHQDIDPEQAQDIAHIADYLQSVERARQIYPLISTLVAIVFFFACGRHHGRRRCNN